MCTVRRPRICGVGSRCPLVGARPTGVPFITLPMLGPAKGPGDPLGQDTHPTDRTTHEEAFEQDQVSESCPVGGG